MAAQDMHPSKSSLGIHTRHRNCSNRFDSPFEFLKIEKEILKFQERIRVIEE
jgi:hypothetical protein